MQETLIPQKALTVDAFLDWAQRQPREAGRYELWHGNVVQKHGRAGSLNAEQAGHRRMKSRLFVALSDAVSAARIAAEVEPDGATVKLSDDVSFEPDALVYLGALVPSPSLVIDDPLIVCEVLSPATRRFDLNEKRTAYFQIPSIHHYLVGDPGVPELLHHWRDETEPDGIGSAVFGRGAGTIQLDPPGILLDVDRVLGT